MRRKALDPPDTASVARPRRRTALRNRRAIELATHTAGRSSTRTSIHPSVSRRASVLCGSLPHEALGSAAHNARTR